MKKFLIAIMLFAMSGCCGSSEQTLSAVEAPIRVVGRTAELADGSIQFDWSGVYIDIRFKGTYLAIELSDTKCNYYNLMVDGVAQEKFKSEGEHTTVVLFDDAAATGEHHIRIQKATEAEQGRVTLHTLTTDGRLLATDALKLPRHIEFYGDSLTCGYGTESKSGSEPFLPETENCRYTYAALTAAHFGADYNLISHSGRGLVRNYGDAQQLSDPTTTMSARAFRLYDEDPDSAWDFAKSPYRPDAIVITLGTNDFSIHTPPTEEQYIAGYRALIAKLREAWGAEIPVLCVVHASQAVECVAEMVKTIPATAMADISWGVYNRTTDLGASEHPNRYGQEKMAKVVIEKFAELTSWE
jgi:lysophospholipase L1-like esterase